MNLGLVFLSASVLLGSAVCSPLSDDDKRVMRNEVLNDRPDSLRQLISQFEPDKEFLDSLFTDAARYGSLECMKALMDYKVDIHSENDLAIKAAAMSNRKKSVDFILENYGDFEGYGGKLLTSFVSRNYLPEVEYLLEHGARNENVLHDAVSKNRIPMVELLLKYGADIHKNNEAALFAALDKRNREMVRLLVARGADPNAREYLAERYRELMQE